MPRARRRSQGGPQPHGFFCLAYSPSGNLIVGGTVYGTLHAWDVTPSDTTLALVESHVTESIIRHIQFITNEIVLCATDDTTVYQWNVRTGENAGKTFTAHQAAVLKLAWLVSGNHVASIDKEGQLLLWCLDTLEVTQKLHIALDTFLTFAFSSDGTRLVARQRDTLCIYDVEHCRKISEFNLPSPTMRTCSLECRKGGF